MTEQQKQITEEFNALIPELRHGMRLLEAHQIILDNYKAIKAERDQLKAARDKAASGKAICEDCGSALARF